MHYQIIYDKLQEARNLLENMKQSEKEILKYDKKNKKVMACLAITEKELSECNKLLAQYAPF